MNDISEEKLVENTSADEEEAKLKSERYDEFRNALEILYILDNISARTRFIQDWPIVADYVFGAELIDCDTNGTDDRERRQVLESEAEAKRLELLTVMVTLEEQSVVKGVLQTDHVDQVVKELGRDLALLLYAPRFVDRIFPPPEPDPDSEETADGDDVVDGESENVDSMDVGAVSGAAQQSVENGETPNVADSGSAPVMPEPPSPLDVQPLDAPPPVETLSSAQDLEEIVHPISVEKPVQSVAAEDAAPIETLLEPVETEPELPLRVIPQFVSPADEHPVVQEGSLKVVPDMKPVPDSDLSTEPRIQPDPLPEGADVLLSVQQEAPAFETPEIDEPQDAPLFVAGVVEPQDVAAPLDGDAPSASEENAPVPDEPVVAVEVDLPLQEEVQKEDSESRDVPSQNLAQEMKPRGMPVDPDTDGDA